MAWVWTFALALTIAALTWMPAVAARPRAGWLLAGLAAALPLVWIPEERWARLLISAFAVVFAARSWERTHGRGPDLQGSVVRFVVWWFVPAEARFPADSKEAARNRIDGFKRLGRMLGKLAIVFVLALINRVTEDITANVIVFAAWSMLFVYALISAIADGVTGLVMTLGVRMSETFDAPFLARSPRDFWGRRWNLFVTRWAFRNVFVPAGGVRAGVRATMLVFLVSGLMHEYLVFTCGGGFGTKTGHTLAFFLLQGVGVVALGRSRRHRLPRSAAILLQLAFMIATTPLFFRPLDDALGYSRWFKGEITRWADGKTSPEPAKVPPAELATAASASPP